ncbi:hypothetical protein, partial [Mycobacterium marseillense]|uniref:hypothetical protein n=1 Tax=Mycobacterium marseillense TaxID=701042 RepID=UPI000AEB3AB2
WLLANALPKSRSIPITSPVDFISGPRIDGYEIRSAAVSVNIPCVTTVQGASAAVQGIEAGIRGDIGVRSLQELHSQIGQGGLNGNGAR